MYNSEKEILNEELFKMKMKKYIQVEELFEGLKYIINALGLSEIRGLEKQRKKLYENLKKVEFINY